MEEQVVDALRLVKNCVLVFFLEKSHHQAVDEIHVTLAIVSCLGSTLVCQSSDVKLIIQVTRTQSVLFCDGNGNKHLKKTLCSFYHAQCSLLLKKQWDNGSLKNSFLLLLLKI